MQIEEKRYNSAKKIITWITELSAVNETVCLLYHQKTKCNVGAHNYGVNMDEVKKKVLEQCDPQQVKNVKNNSNNIPSILLDNCRDPIILSDYLLNVLNNASGEQLVQFYRHLYLIIDSIMSSIKQNKDIYGRHKTKVDGICLELANISDTVRT